MGADDVMFPPPPPFVPVAPLVLISTSGHTWEITQNADGVYYGECRDWGKRIMTICTGCWLRSHFRLLKLIGSLDSYY